MLSIFNDLYRLNREMNRVLGSGRVEYGFWPEVNVYANENEYMVVAKVPGMAREDIAISMKDNSLKIAGEMKKAEQTNVNYHLRERKSGKFERNLLLDEKFEVEKITAEISNGLLLIKIPKSPETKPVKIEIK